MIQTEYNIENGIPVIYIFSRDKNGKRIVKKDKTFKPYFYVLREDASAFKREDGVLKVENIETKDIHRRSISKITVKLPKHVPILRKLVKESFESDILYPIRYNIDKFDQIDGVPLSVVYLDIETNSDKRFPDAAMAQDEITLISCFNNLNKKCITFAWRQDQQQRISEIKKCSFKNSDGSIYEYEDVTMYFDNEIDMLNKFLHYIQDIDPDMVTGWNVIAFDTRYIINRMKNVGINYNLLSPMNFAMTNEQSSYKDVVIKGRIVFDMCEAVRKMSYGESENYRLNTIAFRELGEKKISHPIENGKKISHSKFWKTNLPLYIEYNKKDTMLVYRIQKKKQIIQSFDEIRRMSKCSFNDVFNNSKVVDSFVLSYCKDRYILPAKGGHEKVSYEGGKVLTTKKGMHKWILVFDFKAHYVKIISSLNSSPETIMKKKTDKTVNLHIPYIDSAHSDFWRGEGKKRKFNNVKYDKVRDLFGKYFESHWDIYKQEFSVSPTIIQKYLRYKDIAFNQDKKGFIPEILEYLFDERVKMQTERDTYDYTHPEYQRLEFKQYGFKMLLNSFYGVLGFHHFRLYTPEIAASITFVARNSIIWNKLITKKHGFETMYGDTDSTFISGKTKPVDGDIQPVIDEGFRIIKFLQESYGDFASFFNIKKHYLKIDFEKVFERIFFGQAKKRYAGMLAWYKGKETKDVKIVGFEVVRSDHSHIARRTQRTVFEMLTQGTGTKEDVIKYVKGIMKEVKADKYSYEDIGIPTPLKRELSDYKTNMPVIRGVTYSNRHLKLDLRKGEKFLLLYVKDIPRLPSTDVIAFRENQDVPKGTIIDYNKHIDEATKDKMRSLFDGLGWSLDELNNQKGLFDKWRK